MPLQHQVIVCDQGVPIVTKQPTNVDLPVYDGARKRSDFIIDAHRSCVQDLDTMPAQSCNRKDLPEQPVLHNSITGLVRDPAANVAVRFVQQHMQKIVYPKLKMRMSASHMKPSTLQRNDVRSRAGGQLR
jgi:hypothetical protein